MKYFTWQLLSLDILCMMATLSNGAQNKPNIVFIMGESVASSAYFFGETAPMPIPNLQFLMQNGVSFPQTYAASPVCNPSRATTITGRHAHKHGHYQLNPNTNLWVNGTWNNHEGLDPHENNTFFNFTRKYADYNYAYFGKVDWTAGEHSLSCRVTAWCNKVSFPYTLDSSVDSGYGWYDEYGARYSDKQCNEPGPNCTIYSDDWTSVQQTADWIKQASQSQSQQPFLAYWGSKIVHPPYDSTTYWLSQINMSMVDAPAWIDRDEMHPEDFQSSMKKKFFGDCCTDQFKQQIRAHYYAAIAEYDSMIGVIIDALREANVLDNTWIIATSDHGDMKMEHRQFYKMVFYDSSSRVPSIIYGGNNLQMQRNVIYNNVIASMLDYFPTIMDMAGIDWSATAEQVELDGYSLMPYVLAGNESVLPWQQPDHHADHAIGPLIYDEFDAVVDRPNYVMSQFHGDDIRLSWFMLRDARYKYVVYGSGQEVPPRLFDMANDAMETNDLADNTSYAEILQAMDAQLRKIIDYPAVAADAEAYNKQSFVLWRDSFINQSVYNASISKELRWSESWSYDSNGCFRAIDEWLQTPNDTFFWAVSDENKPYIIV